jgi:antirestriction protein ArdC
MDLKGPVRKGEKGTPIVFYKQLQDRKDGQTATDEKKERIPFVLCYYTVFNVEQCDGLTLPQIDQPTTSTQIETDETCEAIVTGWANRPALHLTGEHEYRAYYRPSSDSVHMPARSRFVDAPHYYSTLFHELVHSTGHESRLHRSFGADFAGIANEHTDRNTTAYLQNWISQLQEDNRLIVQAAANAQKAVDLILGTAFESEAETEERDKEAATSGFPAPEPQALAA